MVVRNTGVKYRGIFDSFFIQLMHLARQLSDTFLLLRNIWNAYYISTGNSPTGSVDAFIFIEALLITSLLM